MPICYVLIEACETRLLEMRTILWTLDFIELYETYGEFNYIGKKEFEDSKAITDFVISLRKTNGIAGVKILEVLGA